MWAINHTLDPGVMNKGEGEDHGAGGELNAFISKQNQQDLSPFHWKFGNSVGFYMKRHEGLVVKLYAK